MTNPEEWTAFNRAEYKQLPTLEEELTRLEFRAPFEAFSNERSRLLRISHLTKKVSAIRRRLGFSDG